MYFRFIFRVLIAYLYSGLQVSIVNMARVRMRDDRYVRVGHVPVWFEHGITVGHTVQVSDVHFR